MSEPSVIAYFSMEIGLDADAPTYAGGLGVLAGDTIRAAADLSVPMVAVTLIHRHGYFYQDIDSVGRQSESPVRWAVDDFLEPTDAMAEVSISGRRVAIRAWKRDVRGAKGHIVPVYFLDADLPQNDAESRRLTDNLYGGDHAYRLSQEVILGIGGVRILRALGYREIRRYHMNEGHSSLLTLELLSEELARSGSSEPTASDLDAVRDRCVFTTHTPVPAGHDRFPMELAHRIIDSTTFRALHDLCCYDGSLNMTWVALNLSRFINGVAKRHAEVSRHLFARYEIDAITNGVHAETWVSTPMAEVFDTFVSGWREDALTLRSALAIPPSRVWRAHLDAKRALIEHANHETNAGLDVDVFTIGIARRMTAYKRAGLIFSDLDRLRAIAAEIGPIQIVFSGKAHPRDEEGKSIIQGIFRARDALREEIRVAFLRNYDMTVARLITAGSDLWLNTPQPPLEASGTSGMKAALNGVPSLSILDGWWIEGAIEGVTGWSIGSLPEGEIDARERKADADAMYAKLEELIIPLFYRDRNAYIDVMRHAIALNGSYFNTDRMMRQYVLKAYF